MITDWAIVMPRFVQPQPLTGFRGSREFELSGYREVGGTVTPLWNPRP